MAKQLVKRTRPTVNETPAQLMQLALLENITGKYRGRVLAYRQYPAILSEETDPLSP